MLPFPALVLSALLGTSVAAATPPPTYGGAPILKLADVKPGMKGYGLTVFSGTKPDRFAVEVVGVLRNFLPRQDVILIRSDDPRLLHSGIVAGMSGSPVYIDGKVIGAVAYGWAFSKDPIAGVTPIESMLAELKRPLRGRGATPTTLAEDHRSLDELLARRSEAQRALPLFGQLPLPPALTATHGGRLVRAALPLTISGAAPEIVKELDEALKPHHIVALDGAGGTRSDRTGPTQFENGGAIGVQLIRGDISATGTGTVTYVDGQKLVAFGHPMFSAGENYLPVATAEIFTFMASLATSFKIASPIAEIGSLIQDRQTCIAADTSLRTDMIPMTAHIKAPGLDDTFRAEVARHRFLTPMLGATVLGSATHSLVSDLADASITVGSQIRVAGQKPLELVDHLFSIDGASSRALGGTLGMRALSEIVFNPFEAARIEGVDYTVEIAYKPELAEIVNIALTDNELEAGSRPSAIVTLRPYRGADRTIAIPFDVPSHLAGQAIKLVAASGAVTKPDLAPAENLKQHIDNLRKGFPARAVVLSIELPDEGVTLRGRVVHDLPSSVIDTLRPSAASRRGEVLKKQQRIVVPTTEVIVGKSEVAARIRELPSMTR